MLKNYYAQDVFVLVLIKQILFAHKNILIQFECLDIFEYFEFVEFVIDENDGEIVDRVDNEFTDIGVIGAFVIGAFVIGVACVEILLL